MKSVVTVLSSKKLKARYAKLANTRMAKLTEEAIRNGYSIACVQIEGLGTSKLLDYDVQVALEQSVPKTSVIHIWCYTDLSEFRSDKVYVAFKELKGRACAHSFSADHCRIS